MASLSHRCFEQVDQIVKKYRQGQLLLANKRATITASSFTFLEKKTEEERYRDLSEVAEGTKSLSAMRKMQHELREKRKSDEGISDLRKPNVKTSKVYSTFIHTRRKVLADTITVNRKPHKYFTVWSIDSSVFLLIM